MILHGTRFSDSIMALIYLTIFTHVLSFSVAIALAQDFNFNLLDNKGNSSFDLSFFVLKQR